MPAGAACSTASVVRRTVPELAPELAVLGLVLEVVACTEGAGLGEGEIHPIVQGEDAFLYQLEQRGVAGPAVPPDSKPVGSQ